LNIIRKIIITKERSGTWAEQMLHLSEQSWMNEDPYSEMDADGVSIGED
jgi:hypothetical protein